MATPGPVKAHPLCTLLQSHPCCPASYYKCQRILIWSGVTKSSQRQWLCLAVRKGKVLTFICADARHYQYFISNCKFPADLLFLSFMNDINCRLKHHGREQCSCKQCDRFWTNLINAAPLMNTLVSFGNKLLRQLKYSWEPFRLRLL